MQIYIRIVNSRMKREQYHCKDTKGKYKKKSDLGTIDMQNLNHTQYFQVVQEPKPEVSEVIEKVYEALSEKGYNPVSQIVGYIMSGDPTYITSHKNARSLIMKVERDELLEEVLKFYIGNKIKS